MTEPSCIEKSPIPKPSSEPLQMEIDHPSAPQMSEISQYEQSRELRIRENMERMQKLGILDLSLKLKSSAPSKQNRRKSLTPKASPPSFDLPPPGPLRRSSRLQNATPVTYSELRMERKNKFSEDEDAILEDGSRPEIYTEEHEKMLGCTERSWTLFVDGYGKDGKRIYDPVKGKTCHQCRQKTLGYRTHCSKCNMVQGQFCGDCLYMRYGEHVLEAQQNPDWICPVCRGICNCSLCRQGKGWLPTGPLYKKITRMGFKSVAHFLIQTKRSQPSSEENTTDLASAKRSLSFTDFEVNPDAATKVNDDLLETMEPQAVDVSENEKKNMLQSISSNEIKDHISVKRSLSFSGLEQQGSKDANPNHLNHDELSQHQSANHELGENIIDEKEKEMDCHKRKNGDNYCPDECPLTEKKPTITVESNTMDLGCSTGNDHEKESSGVQTTTSSTDQSVKPDISTHTSSESIAEECLQEGGIQESNGKTSDEEGSNSLSKKKTKAGAKISTSSEVKSLSSNRVLRSRFKAI
ncbi:cell division cycle-associated protein 7 [Cucumis melo var. makuwa]|uniref:Cell division cycle-associated protein 7 n=2 Tax=Cucumis melo TaxID=3656 RepID=A0A5A7TX53_CUCMM|nr:cell division cycle-associated protein 7 [Cucumis melo var. makuwa]TYK13729.1 cell division cycle-associated protein 7 [Cucumis melo var. makuwa]